jgi:type II secretion system protein G
MKVNIFKNKTKLMRGFTLIELLVVISIIGMLASVVLVSLQGAKTKAREIKFLAEIQEFKKSLELYRLDNGRYPRLSGWYNGTAATCLAGATNGNVWTQAGLFDDTYRSKYMSTLPTELVSCGIYYLGIDGTSEHTTLTCVDGNGVTIHPDGYTAPNVKAVPFEPYAYLILIKPLTNISSVSYPIVSWPNPDPTMRCVLGPKL